MGLHYYYYYKNNLTGIGSFFVLGMKIGFKECFLMTTCNKFSQVINIMSEDIETHVLARFDIVKKIGSGAYGHVWKVTDKKTRKVKALKKNFDAFNNSTDAQRTYR